jgi:hypothetical protein
MSQVSMVSALRTFLACFLGGVFFLAKPCESQDVADSTKYFVASFPSQGKIVYMKEGQKVVRDLIIGGHESLGAIAIDQTHARLYVADVAIFTIFWYQLVALPDGRLTTDGRKNTALVTIDARSMECDGEGNLYVGGQAITAVTPSAPAPPVSIMKFAWFQLLTGVTSIIPSQASGIWNVANSGDPAKMWNPSSIVTDGFRLFWGNKAQGGTHGTILEAPVSPPDTDPVGSIKVHVDQGEEVGSLALTPEFLFYSTENGIFGTPVYKSEQGCGRPAETKKKALNPVKLSLKNGGGGPPGPCRRITSEIVSTKGMVWDGDGTVFTLDPKKGIYSFPSGNAEEHHITTVVEIEGLEDMGMLQISYASMKAVPSVIFLVVSLAVMILRM